MKNLLLNIVRLIGFAVAIFGLINLFILLYDADPTEEHKMLLFLVIAGVGTVLFIGVYTYEALKDDSWKPTEEELKNFSKLNLGIFPDLLISTLSFSSFS